MKHMNIEELNKRYLPLSPAARIHLLYTDFARVLLTSSFGTTAAYLLHLFSLERPGHAVYFLDTTYHFPETLAYRDELIRHMGLHVISLQGDNERNTFTGEDKTWEKDADLCCSINKVEPLEKIKPDFQVWVSGLMRGQNEHRDTLSIFEERQGILKFYPILDQNAETALSYMQAHKIPKHPLQEKGYASVGCTHCTVQGNVREGRWINKSKTECGLHL
jgi:phosphoadenosine phosphosulfate reductase